MIYRQSTNEPLLKECIIHIPFRACVRVLVYVAYVSVVQLMFESHLGMTYARARELMAWQTRFAVELADANLNVVVSIRFVSGRVETTLKTPLSPHEDQALLNRSHAGGCVRSAAHR